MCKNTKGSHNGMCKPGYYGDGDICRLGKISPAVFLKLVFVCLDYYNNKFCNNYVYRDIDI